MENHSGHQRGEVAQLFSEIRRITLPYNDHPKSPLLVSKDRFYIATIKN
jgi:hypothetical protein